MTPSRPEPWSTEALRDACLGRLPEELRELVLAELAAGNRVVVADGGFPAPATGVCVRLARPVTTRPRAATERVLFVERHGASHGGEFSDLRRVHFVVEPPRPPHLEADMEAIRAEMRDRERASDDQRTDELYR